MIKSEKAHLVPFFAFMAGLGLVGAIHHVCEGIGPFWLAMPQYWIFPLQTLICGTLLWHYRRHYRFLPLEKIAWTVFISVLVLVIWIAPQEWFGAPARRDGFDPRVFSGQPFYYWATLTLRFIRLVVVVPFLEEIFWRGYLLRYLIQPDFERVEFGLFQWRSFLIVALLFMLAHQPADYPAAFACGLAYNFIAIRTRSLGCCVLAHALTNLLLGGYIMATGQWGFW